MVEDAAEAVGWYRRAAEQGHVAAQTNLAGIYANGRGVAQDMAEAVRWYRRAAEQGLTEALRWIHLTAEQGSLEAQVALGEIYDNGDGVPQDLVQAHTWFYLAAAQASGEERAKYEAARDAVAERLTSDQLAEAQRRARAWEAAHAPESVRPR